MTTQRIGIVCSGGGMRCAYSAGALDALYYELGLTEPAVLIGASGSAGSCAYFASKQGFKGKTIWCDHLTNGQMISWRTWPILNINYLVRTVFEKRFPLDIAQIKQSPIHTYIPVTNTLTGELEYIALKDQATDIFRTLIAAKTIPVIAGQAKPLKQNGPALYIDSDFPQQLVNHVAFAKSLGCEKIIIIDNSRPHGTFMRLLIHMYSLTGTRHYRNYIKSKLNGGSVPLEITDTTLLMTPSHTLSMNPLTDANTKVVRAYEMGYQDTIHNPALKQFLYETKR